MQRLACLLSAVRKRARHTQVLADSIPRLSSAAGSNARETIGWY
jgi:hypothetical protein